mmetsp:Transcript_22397/g.70201  ORF Transcript_22397/g.70201 Transcript_22397/m.70201 type:complete len:204 (+) Transcript_22397:155-766(+)
MRQCVLGESRKRLATVATGGACATGQLLDTVLRREGRPCRRESRPCRESRSCCTGRCRRPSRCHSRRLPTHAPQAARRRAADAASPAQRTYAAETGAGQRRWWKSESSLSRTVSTAVCMYHEVVWLLATYLRWRRRGGTMRSPCDTARKGAVSPTIRSEMAAKASVVWVPSSPSTQRARSRTAAGSLASSERACAREREWWRA